MRRKIEWVLALCGAAVCTLDAATFWKFLPGPGTPFWPLTDFPLLEIIILGWVGVAGVAMDSGQRSNAWGAIPWVVTGCLAPCVILGAITIGPLLIPAGGLFIGAGVLANLRRQRSLLPDLTFFSAGAIVNLVVILTLAKAIGSI